MMNCEAKVEMRELLNGRRRFRGRIEGFADGEVKLTVKTASGETHSVGLPAEGIVEAKLVGESAPAGKPV